uniref:Uncharacterized protein n=1 Tax=Triticum urartu TaxID=4572 RepID=A0A8R7TJN5_TRIUA
MARSPLGDGPGSVWVRDGTSERSRSGTLGRTQPAFLSFGAGAKASIKKYTNQVEFIQQSHEQGAAAAAAKSGDGEAIGGNGERRRRRRRRPGERQRALPRDAVGGGREGGVLRRGAPTSRSAPPRPRAPTQTCLPSLSE